MELVGVKRRQPSAGESAQNGERERERGKQLGGWYTSARWEEEDRGLGGSWRVTGWNDNNQNLCSGAGGSNPIESSEPSISDPSRRVKGKENRELDVGGRVGSVGGVGKEGKNQCSIILSLPPLFFTHSQLATRKRHPTWIHLLLLRVQVTSDTRRCYNHDDDDAAPPSAQHEKAVFFCPFLLLLSLPPFFQCGWVIARKGFLTCLCISTLRP